MSTRGRNGWLDPALRSVGADAVRSSWEQRASCTCPRGDSHQKAESTREQKPQPNRLTRQGWQPNLLLTSRRLHQEQRSCHLKCPLWACSHPMTHPQHLPLMLPWELMQKQEMAVCLLVFGETCSLLFWLSLRTLSSSGQKLSVLIFASPDTGNQTRKNVWWVDKWTKAFEVLRCKA